jgi:hypothetical protein
MQVRTLFLLTLTLCGCSTADTIPDWVSDGAVGPEPINYRFAVANTMSAVLTKQSQDRLVEITNPRRVDIAKGAMWMVCMKISTYPDGQARAHYAIFSRNEKVTDWRLSVGVDQCEIQTYRPFDWRTDVNNPIFR